LASSPAAANLVFISSAIGKLNKQYKMPFFNTAYSGDKGKDASPLDDQPVPAPDKPDIPE
jgi:hypothetical protein